MVNTTISELTEVGTTPPDALAQFAVKGTTFFIYDHQVHLFPQVHVGVTKEDQSQISLHVVGITPMGESPFEPEGHFNGATVITPVGFWDEFSDKLQTETNVLYPNAGILVRDVIVDVGRVTITLVPAIS